MYLLLGNSQDPWCLLIGNLLKIRGQPYRHIVSPLSHPSGFAWELCNDCSLGQIVWQDGSLISNDQISGVLVCNTMNVTDPEGWQPDDFAYVQAELQASVLAWLWSLDCPVVNRYPAAMWCRAQLPLLYWQPLLTRCGLTVLETLVTNVPQVARSFGQRQSIKTVNSVVYGPLNSDVRYLITSEKDWNSLDAMQTIAPVCLMPPHGAPQFVCVVGQRVVWGDPASGMALFEPALRHFAAAAGLGFVELAFALVSGTVCVVAVDTTPNFSHFSGASRQQIAELILQVLLEKNGNVPQNTTASIQNVSA